MKKFITLVLTAIAVLIITACSTEYKGLQASMPDLGGKADGVYHGKYHVSGTPVTAAVAVTVQDGKLAHIQITEHICSPIGKKAEKITSSIIDSQSLSVDVVSGATASSKAILKAVENALQSSITD